MVLPPNGIKSGNGARSPNSAASSQIPDELPQYRLAGQFSGTEIAGATKWLRKLERDLSPYRGEDGKIPAPVFLESIYFLITDDAEEWAEGDYAVAEAFENPSAESLDLVVRKIKERFPGRRQKPTTNSFRDVINELTQEMSENLEAYYGRVQGQFKQFLCQDPDSTSLTSSDLFVRNMVVTAWMDGLLDENLRDELAKQTGGMNSSLTEVFETALRIERSFKAVERRRDSKYTEIELNYYREQARQGKIPGFITRSTDPPSQRSTYPRRRMVHFPEGQVQDPALSTAQREPPAFTNTSANDFVNGRRQYDPVTMGTLCIRCGDIGHFSPNCPNPPLPSRDRAVLRSIINTSRYGQPSRPAQEPESPTTVPRVSSVSASFATATDIANAIAEVNLGDGTETAKRLRTEDGEAVPVQDEMTSNQATDDRTKLKPKRRVGKEATLSPIVGLVGDNGQVQKPKSVRKILSEMKPDLSVLDLMAWSPSIAQEMKRLAAKIPSANPKPRSRKKQPPKPNATNSNPGEAPSNVVVGMAAVASDDAHTKRMTEVGGEDRAFRIPVVIETIEGRIELKRSLTQADQGSDLNVIGKSLAVRLGLDLRPLSEVGFKGMAMRVANGSITSLSEYTRLSIGVAGLWRTIYCFVIPEEAEEILPASEVKLLLGLPWLHSVDAIIGIRDGSIRIGDSVKGEESRLVQGPEMVFCQDHSMLLYPKSSVKQVAEELRGKVISEDPTDNESSSDEDHESSSGEESSESGF